MELESQRLLAAVTSIASIKARIQRKKLEIPLRSDIKMSPLMMTVSCYHVHKMRINVYMDSRHNLGFK